MQELDNIKQVKAELMTSATVMYIHCPNCKNEDMEINPIEKLYGIRKGGVIMSCEQCNTKFLVKDYKSIPVGHEEVLTLSPFEFEELVRKQEVDLVDNDIHIYFEKDRLWVIKDGWDGVLYNAALTFKERL